jgi:hypothetical protein
MPVALDKNNLAKLTSMVEDLTDLSVKPDFKGMIYGDSGAGKTIAAVALAQRITGDSRTILYVDSGQGWVSLENHPTLKQRVQRLRFATLAQLELVEQAIRNGSDVFGSVGTIIIDEASTVATLDLDRVVTKRAEVDAGKDPDTPTQPDFNTAGNRVRKVFDALGKLDGVHFIMVAHVRKDKDNRGVEVTSPRFLPAVNSRIREPLHLVAYMTADLVPSSEGEVNYRRVLQVHPSRQIVAKTRIGGFGAEITPKDLIKGVDEWINKNRETVDKQTVVSEPVVEMPSESEEFTGITVEGD